MSLSMSLSLSGLQQFLVNSSKKYSSYFRLTFATEMIRQTFDESHVISITRLTNHLASPVSELTLRWNACQKIILIVYVIVQML